MENPLVSIIIPTYKRSSRLDNAINSILRQTYRNWELIVVDDNNTNTDYRKSTEKLMNGYKNTKIKYVRHCKNKGGAAARNTGIYMAQGEYIAFLDDDDEFMPNKIKLQVQLLNNYNDNWGGVYSGFYISKENKVIKQSNELKHGNLKNDLLLKRWDIGSGSNLFFRKNVLEKLEGFDVSFERHQDWELLIRFFRYYKILTIEKHLLKINMDSNINRPTGYKLRDTKKLFLSKFEEDISECTKNTQQKIFKKHWLDVSLAFIRDRNYREAFFYYKKANNYCFLTMKEKILLLIYILDMDDSLKYKFKKIFKKFNLYK